MALSREAIKEFKEICCDEFGVDLSDTDAEQRALEVLDFFWLLSTETGPEKGSDLTNS